MHFRNLILLYTDPLSWEPDPLGFAARLRDFLLFFVDPTKEGYAALGVSPPQPDREGETFDWRNGQNANNWIEQTFDQVWRPMGELMQGDEEDASVNAFDRFVTCRACMFLDTKRLDSCLERPVPHGTYLSFLVDWSHFQGRLLWTPQLRIANYWPGSRSLAPDPPSSAVPLPLPMDPETAARLLADGYWMEVETAFRKLRRSHGLGTALMAGGSFMPPVFYYASPTSTSIPATPGDYLSSHCFLPLETMSRITLGTEDPLSADVAGSFLEGNLLTLRRERTGRLLMALYLIIPWYYIGRDWDDEIENNLCTACDQLAFLDFSVVDQVHRFEADLAIDENSIALWRKTLDGSADLAARLRQLVGFEPRRSPTRKTAFQMISDIRLALSELETRLLAVTHKITQAESDWRTFDESAISEARSRISERHIPQLPPLLGSLNTRNIYRRYIVHLTDVFQNTRQLREHFVSIATALSGMLDLERREEREQQDRNQRTLNVALAALTVVMAFPIVIGQLSWSDLKNAGTYWPAFLQWHDASTIDSIHGNVVLGVGIMALLIIAFLSAYVVLTVWPIRLNSSTYVLEMKKKITRIWGLADQARCRMEDAHTAERGEDIRAVIADLDKDACAILSEAWCSCLDMKTGISQRRAKSHTDIKGVCMEVELFIVLLELFCLRPVLWLPVALCLFRYKGADLVSRAAVSDEEFRKVFSYYDFGNDDIQAIEVWGKRLSHLSPPDFVGKMREIGVSALHEQISSPEQATPPA